MTQMEREGACVQGNQVFLPVMIFSCFYHCYQINHKWVFLFQFVIILISGVWCCKLCSSGTFLCLITDSSPFINTVYQQPVGLPTRGWESMPEWHSYRPYEQQHRKNNSTFLDMDTRVQRVHSCCKVDRKNRTLLLTFIRVWARTWPQFCPTGTWWETF